MKKNTSTSIMAVGPFGKSAKMLEDFASDLYISYLFDDSLKRQKELEQEYESALLKDDKELAQLRKSEMELMEGVHRLSFSMFRVDELVS
tara:strand:- start:571 stop:840 length:270 start_codon:yes stop_codon:yes gene_type:complete